MKAPENAFIYPKFLESLIKKINELPTEKVEKLAKYVESILFGERDDETSLDKRDAKIAKELDIKPRLVTNFGVTYVSLRRVFLQETNDRNFIDNLAYIGLDNEKGKVFWNSLNSHKTEIENTLSKKEALLSIVPKLMEVAWRVEEIKASSGQTFLPSSVGIISIGTAETGEHRVLRFEVNELSLNYLVDELLKLRDELNNVLKNDKEDKSQGRLEK